MEEINKIEFRKHRDFGEIINVTFEFIRENFKKLFLSLLFIAGPLIIITGIANGILQNDFYSLTADFSTFTYMMINYFFMFLTIQVIIAVTYSYIILYLYDDSGDFDVNDVWSKTKEYLGLVFITSILMAIIIIFSSILIIPGIYFAITLSIIYIIRINENTSFSQAFKRCRYLIQNNWWYTFGLIIIFTIIQMILSFVLTIPTYIYMFISMMHMVEGTVSSVSIFSIIASIIASLSYLFYSISLIGLAFYYFNLVERKEAAGLMDRISSMNSPETI